MTKKNIECISLDARDLNTGRVMEKTEPCEFTGEMYLAVPDGYYADIYIDGVLMKKVKPCVRKSVKKLIGAEHIGKMISVLFVNRRPLNDMSWGIGNLPMRYKNFGDACIKVGANGFFRSEITDNEAFYDSFEREFGSLNLTETASVITSAFRDMASKILLDIFDEAIQPIFDTDFLISEVEIRLNRQLCNTEFNALKGVAFRRITVSGICVCEEDVREFKEKFSSTRASAGKKTV